MWLPVLRCRCPYHYRVAPDLFLSWKHCFPSGHQLSVAPRPCAVSLPAHCLRSHPGWPSPAGHIRQHYFHGPAQHLPHFLHWSQPKMRLPYAGWRVRLHQLIHPALSLMSVRCFLPHPQNAQHHLAPLRLPSHPVRSAVHFRRHYQRGFSRSARSLLRCLHCFLSPLRWMQSHLLPVWPVLLHQQHSARPAAPARCSAQLLKQVVQRAACFSPRRSYSAEHHLPAVPPDFYLRQRLLHSAVRYPPASRSRS